MKFEESLNRLEQIVSKLEDSELDLEESLKLYEEGILLSRSCNDILAEADRKVYILKNNLDIEDAVKKEEAKGQSTKDKKEGNKDKSKIKSLKAKAKVKEEEKMLEENFDLFDKT